MCKSTHRYIIKQLDLQLLTVTLSMGTSVLCMAHPLMKPYLYGNVNKFALVLFRVIAEM